MQDGATIIKDWFQRVWAEGDLAAIDAYFAEDAQAEGLVPGFEVDKETFKVFVPALRQLVRSIAVELVQSHELSGWTWALVRVSCYSDHTGEPAAITGQVMARIRCGRITAAYNHFDFLSFFEQLGLLPEDTMALLMTGQKIG